MKWFHAADDQRNGPFTSDEIHALIGAKKITPTTLVWHEGMAEWKPFAEVESDLPAPEPEERWEPVAPEDDAELELESGDPQAHLQRALLASGGFSLREAFSRGWETVSHRPGLTIGVLALYFFVSLITSKAELISALITAPVLGGVYWINLRMLRNQPVSFGDILEPLKRCYLQVVLVQLMQGMVVALLCLPFLRERTMSFAGETIKGYTVDFIHSPAGWMALAALIYAMITLMFALPLVIDQRLRAWEAVVWSFRFTSRHFFKVALLGVLLGCFAMMGLIIFFFGALLTCAIAIAGLCAVYVRLVTPDDSGAPLPPSSPAVAAPPDSPQ